MKTIHQYERNIYSQQGEDGIIEECLKRIHTAGLKDTNNGVCAEFGAHDGKFCSNTRFLFEAGWKGKMIEGDPELFMQCCSNMLGMKCNVINAMVTKDNVNVFLDGNIDVLSMDTDGPDAEIWEAYTGSPDIVIIEINSSLDPEKDFYSPDKGANFSYMNKLAEIKGYFLLCHTGNCIYLLNKYKELFPDADVNFKRDWLC